MPWPMRASTRRTMTLSECSSKRSPCPARVVARDRMAPRPLLAPHPAAAAAAAASRVRAGPGAPANRAFRQSPIRRLFRLSDLCGSGLLPRYALQVEPGFVTHQRGVDPFTSRKRALRFRSEQGFHQGRRARSRPRCRAPVLDACARRRGASRDAGGCGRGTC